jgi:hypothetical protein
VTAHVPAYIPANVFKMAAATNESLLALLTRDEPEAIYVYKIYFLAEDKLQSSWSRWSFAEGARVLNAGFINTNLYLMLQREDGVYLEVLGVDAHRVDAGMSLEVNARPSSGRPGLLTQLRQHVWPHDVEPCRTPLTRTCKRWSSRVRSLRARKGSA